jgi:hypothetical protein
MLDMTNYSTTSFQFAQVLTYEAFYAFLIGLILSTPTYPRLTMYLDGLVQEKCLSIALSVSILRLVLITSLLLFSI